MEEVGGDENVIAFAFMAGYSYIRAQETLPRHLLPPYTHETRDKDRENDGLASRYLEYISINKYQAFIFEFWRTSSQL